MIGTGFVLLAGYVGHARRTKNPLLDLSLFRDATYRHSVTGGSIFRIAVGATPFLLPLMLQLGFGYSALETGLVTFAATFGSLLMKFTVSPIVRYFGFRNLLIWNGLLSCAAIAAHGFFTVETPYLVMVTVLIVAGFFRSLQFSSLNALAYAEFEHKDMARANALYTVLQQLSLALGVAAGAFLLDARLWWAGRSDLVAGDFAFALIVVAAVSAFSVLSFMKLSPNAGVNISGKAVD